MDSFCLFLVFRMEKVCFVYLRELSNFFIRLDQLSAFYLLCFQCCKNFLRIPLMWSFVLVSFLRNTLVWFVATTSLMSTSSPPLNSLVAHLRVSQMAAGPAFHGALQFNPDFTSDTIACCFFAALSSLFTSSLFELFIFLVKCHMGLSLGEKEATQPRASSRCAWTKWQKHGGQPQADFERSDIIGHGHDVHLLCIRWFMAKFAFCS